ncbi:YciI family protein [Psychromicrobium sp. YIM B11713]|uniref:YciI family protein n=1 Tax=Psychromicrobium sp. YIM B11713 TaxID=3145233 RepID=UPI00374F890F
MSIYAVEYHYDPKTAGLRDEHRPVHRDWLSSQSEAGVILASGPYPDGSGALLIFRAENEDELRALLQQDPFAIQQCIAGVGVKAWNPVIGRLKEYV